MSFRTQYKITRPIAKMQSAPTDTTATAVVALDPKSATIYCFLELKASRRESLTVEPESRKAMV